jgi:hypothetical protein
MIESVAGAWSNQGGGSISAADGVKLKSADD